MNGKERTTTVNQKLSVQHPNQTRLVNYLLLSLIATWLADLFFGHPQPNQEIEI